jgi:hypothetical protein
LTEWGLLINDTLSSLETDSKWNGIILTQK